MRNESFVLLADLCEKLTSVEGINAVASNSSEDGNAKLHLILEIEDQVGYFVASVADISLSLADLLTRNQSWGGRVNRFSFTLSPKLSRLDVDWIDNQGIITVKIWEIKFYLAVVALSLE